MKICHSQIGLESSRFPGLYKPAVPDQQQILGPTTFEREAQEKDLPHPPKTFEREAQEPDQGQELYTPFIRVGDALMYV